MLKVIKSSCEFKLDERAMNLPFLQARTARVSTDEGGLGNATKFSGIVMYQSQGPSKIQVELDDPMSGEKIYL